MNVYRIEGTAAVTFYIKAKTAKGALRAARDYIGCEAPGMSDAWLSSPELPSVSLSPAMTVLAVDDAPERIEVEA